jgi:hypothetical protein
MQSHTSVPELERFYKVTGDLKELVEGLVKMKRSGSVGGYKDQVKQCVVKFANLKSANREAHDAADRASCEVWCFVLNQSFRLHEAHDSGVS